MAFAPTAAYQGLVISDNAKASVAAWNVAVNGRLSYPEVSEEEARDGYGRYPDVFPGVYAVAIPAYWVARPLVIDPSEPHGGFPEVPIWPATATNVVVCTAGMLVLIELLRRLVSPGLALAGGLAFGLATPFWSVAANALWPHGPDILWLGLALAAVARRRWAVAGAFFGVAVFTRPTLAVVPAVVGLWIGVSERSWRPVVGVGIPAALGLGALSLYTQVLYETWWPIAGYDPARVGGALGTGDPYTHGYSMIQQLWGTLFDRLRGVLVFTPVLLPMVVAALKGWRSAPPWSRAAAVAGLLYWAVQLRSNPFPGGFNFWGYRYPLEPLFLALPLAMVGYATWIAGRAWWRRTTQVLAVASLAMIVPGAIWYSVKPEPIRDEYRTEYRDGRIGTGVTNAWKSPSVTVRKQGEVASL